MKLRYEKIPAQVLAEQEKERAALAQTRLNDMLERYGECCTQMKAAQIVGKTARTIYRMMEDGRLRRVGTDVDVRSIARYLENPRENNFAARGKEAPENKQPLGFFRPACFTQKSDAIRGRKPCLFTV